MMEVSSRNVGFSCSVRFPFLVATVAPGTPTPTIRERTCALGEDVTLSGAEGIRPSRPSGRIRLHLGRSRTSGQSPSRPIERPAPCGGSHFDDRAMSVICHRDLASDGGEFLWETF